MERQGLEVHAPRPPGPSLRTAARGGTVTASVVPVARAPGDARARARRGARRRARPGWTTRQRRHHADTRLRGRGPRRARAPARGDIAGHEEDARLARPPAEERAPEHVREEVGVENDPRGAHPGRPTARSQPAAAAAGPIPSARRQPRRRSPRGPRGSRGSSIRRSTASGRTRAAPARRAASRAPTPQPSTSRGRARHATCLTTWVVSPARRTPATPPTAACHIGASAVR